MEEDIEIIKKHYVFTTNHVLDDENKRFKQAIENLINKYKEQKRDIRDNHILLAKYSQKNEEQENIIELINSNYDITINQEEYTITTDSILSTDYKYIQNKPQINNTELFGKEIELTRAYVYKIDASVLVKDTSAQ